jgi:hypothetical protein
MLFSLKVFSTFQTFKLSEMSCLVSSKGVISIKSFFANFTLEVPFVTMSTEMNLHLKVSFERLATFWTFKTRTVTVQVLFQQIFAFERFSAKFTFINGKFGMVLNMMSNVSYSRKNFSTNVALE